MRAADIETVRTSDSPQHRALLASAEQVPPPGAAAGAAHQYPQLPRPQQQQQAVLRALDPVAVSQATEMLVLRDAVRLMHVQRPGRLVIATYADDDRAPDLLKQGRKCKDVLVGTVLEVLSFLDLLLKDSWQEHCRLLGGGGDDDGSCWCGNND
jgi:hypothetical protein